MDDRRTAADTYAGGVGEFGGTPEARGRLQGNIERLGSGSLRVRVYSGVDVLTGRELYLRQVVPAGPRARQRAEKVRDELVRQVEEGRQPRTNATVAQLVWRHLGSVTAEVLDSFYVKLRRCRDHCDGAPIRHRVEGEHTCDRRCRPHVCQPLKAWTIRKIHYLISGAYEDAIRWDWLSVNPISAPASRRRRRPTRSHPHPRRRLRW